MPIPEILHQPCLDRGIPFPDQVTFQQVDSSFAKHLRGRYPDIGVRLTFPEVQVTNLMSGSETIKSRLSLATEAQQKHKVFPERTLAQAKEVLAAELEVLKDPDNRFRLEIGVNPPWDPRAPRQLKTEILKTEVKEKEVKETAQYPGYPKIEKDGQGWRGASVMGSEAEAWSLTLITPGENMADPPLIETTKVTDGNSELTPVSLLAPGFSLFIQNPAATLVSDASSEVPQAVLTQIIVDESGIWSETSVIEQKDNQLTLDHSFWTEATFGSPMIATVFTPEGQKSQTAIIAEDKYGQQYSGQKFARLNAFDLKTKETVLTINLPEGRWFNGNDQLAVYEGKGSSYITVPLRREGNEPEIDPNKPPKETEIAIYSTRQESDPVLITLNGEPKEIGWATIKGEPRLVVASKYKHEDGTVRGRLQLYDLTGKETISPIEVQAPEGEEWYRFTNIAIVTTNQGPLLVVTGATDFMRDNLFLGVDLAKEKILFSFANKVPYSHYGVIAVRAPTKEEPDRLVVSMVGYKGGQPGINAGFINPSAKIVEFVPLEGMPVSRSRSQGRHSFNRPTIAASGEKGENVALLASVNCLDEGGSFLELYSFDLSGQVNVKMEGSWSQFRGNSRLTGENNKPSLRQEKRRIFLPALFHSS